MSWSVEYSEKAVKQLAKIDAHQRRVLLAWMRKNIDGSENPKLFGKALTSDLTGLWRYRIGTYRILVRFIEDKVIVEVVEVGHRREVYR